MLRVICFLSILLSCTFSDAIAQKKGKEDWKNSPLAMHDKLISKANSQRFASWGMLTAGISLTLGGVAKSIAPAFKDVPKTDIRLLWLPVTGILTTIAAIPMANSSKKSRKNAWQVLEQSASIGNQKQPFARYPAIGLKISL
jgi:hypothetical protein